MQITFQSLNEPFIFLSENTQQCNKYQGSAFNIKIYVELLFIVVLVHTVKMVQKTFENKTNYEILLKHSGVVDRGNRTNVTHRNPNYRPQLFTCLIQNLKIIDNNFTMLLMFYINNIPQTCKDNNETTTAATVN